MLTKVCRPCGDVIIELTTSTGLSEKVFCKKYALMEHLILLNKISPLQMKASHTSRSS